MIRNGVAWGKMINERPAWLTDTVIAYIGFILGVLGIVAAILTYWLSRRPRYLSYRVIKSAPLFSSEPIKKIDRERLSIHWKDDNHERALKSPEIHVIKIVNSGRAGITPGDFIKPIAIIFPRNVSVVAASVLGTRHPGIVRSDELTVDRASGQDTLVVSVAGLSGKDWVEVEVLSEKVGDGSLEVPRAVSESRVERWIRERKQAEATTARLLTVDCWIADQTSPIRRTDTEFEALLWRVIPIVSTKRFLWGLAAVYGVLAIVFAVSAKQSLIDAMWKMPALVLVVIVTALAMGAVYLVLFAPLIAGLWLLRKSGIALLGFLAKRVPGEH